MKSNKPTLKIYRPNPRGTGSAIMFQLVPATPEEDGHILMSMLRQESVGNYNGIKRRILPTFSDEGPFTDKLNIGDISKMLQVFRGMQETISDGRGLYHQNVNGNTIIKMAHRIEPVLGYEIQMLVKPIDGDQMQRTIVLTPTEALGLSLAIEQSMDVIAFGIQI